LNKPSVLKPSFDSPAKDSELRASPFPLLGCIQIPLAFWHAARLEAPSLHRIAINENYPLSTPAWKRPTPAKVMDGLPGYVQGSSSGARGNHVLRKLVPLDCLDHIVERLVDLHFEYSG
jgi:hypothetical protein